MKHQQSMRIELKPQVGKDKKTVEVAPFMNVKKTLCAV